MPESFKKRVSFEPSKQRLFLEQAKTKLKKSNAEMAVIFKVSDRTFRDWLREKYNPPLSVIKKITKLTALEALDAKVLEPFWYVYRGGRIGGKAVLKKYGSIGGDQNIRKERWKKWWNKTGKFKLNNILRPLKIKHPQRDNSLAEFVGIVLGDGGIKKYQLTITLNKITDREYITYVIKLIKRLFGLEPKVYGLKNSLAVNVAVSRKDLVSFCKKIGLKEGDKIRQQVDIPGWIKKNRNFGKKCVRGLMDTDGCVFNECHLIKGKKYCYPRMSFVSHSAPLRLSVYEILQKLGFYATLRNNRSVQIERLVDIKRYFKVIGTSNPKHLQRAKQFIKN